MIVTQNPSFWAMVSMVGLVGAPSVVATRKLGRNPLFGATVVILFGLGRVVVALPFCTQPRFEDDVWPTLVGGIIFALGLVFCLPSLSIKPITAPDHNVRLRTTGFYGLVRNPINFGEVLWCLGWAVIFRSIIGVALVPMWWAGLLLHTMVEEESLERELGQPYLDYKARVHGRIIPGLPI